MDFQILSPRDKAVFLGLFLSKFDKKALDYFHFESYKEAFNTFGYSVGTPLNSIKNYRDEFDPYFPSNPRKGWRNRQLRDYCKHIMDKTKELSFEDFCLIIETFLIDSHVDLKDIRTHETSKQEHPFLINRLITGKAAEAYFVMNYKDIPRFQNYTIVDTTNMGCGFDYKLSLNQENLYIEVKGINEKRGNILMTEKEFYMAEELQERYCLFVVSNFKHTPQHKLFFNPTHHKMLNFEKQEQQILQMSYITKLQD